MPRPPNYVTRADLDWGPTGAGYANPRSGLVIHYDSSDQGLARKSHSACLTYWKNTRAFHTGPSRGWADIGYSWMACAHGYILEGRGLRKQQAAQPGGNATHYSCTLATGPTDEITPEQINAVRALRKWLMESYGVSGKVLGHRDFIPTSCPGDAAYALVQDGTFTKAPGSGVATVGGDPLIGLKKGDEGEGVVGVQVLVVAAGFEDALGEVGVDGRYGDGTAEGVRLAREYVGSRALSHFGDEITGWAYAQLHEAVAKRRAEQHAGGGGVSLPATVRVSGELEVNP